MGRATKAGTAKSTSTPRRSFPAAAAGRSGSLFGQERSEGGRRRRCGNIGIHIGSQLSPLSADEAAELKAPTAEIINDAVTESIDDIEKLRARMKRELESKLKATLFTSEFNA